MTVGGPDLSQSPAASGGPAPRSAADTRMFQEAAEAPEAVARLLAAQAAPLRELAAILRARPPRAVVTLGRGSSDNAATFARYLIETRLGLVTASAPPSVSSVYDRALNQSGMLAIAISQSGRSPDLVAAARAAREAGAFVLALVNAPGSPLEAAADLAVPLGAGREQSVAATKSFITSLAAVAQLVAAWGRDEALEAALEALPDLLQAAWALDWRAAEDRLIGARGLYVLGRGTGFGVAQEAALKLKETCGLHAEAVSAAEVKHGPMALVGPGFPVLAFVQDDATRPGVEAVVGACLAQGAEVLQAGGGETAGVWRLPTPSAHPALEPIAFIQSFYRMAAGLALARGFDPDRPPNLKKVTETF